MSVQIELRHVGPNACDRVRLRIDCLEGDCGYPYSESCFNSDDFPSVKHTETHSEGITVTEAEARILLGLKG
jgi:hypothetical protein